MDFWSTHMKLAPPIQARTDNLPALRQNALLAALPFDALHRWKEHLEPVDMPLGMVLKEQNTLARQAYFPTTAIVSLQYLTSEGQSSETAVIGNDGVVGVCLFMAHAFMPHRAVVENAGQGFRLNAALFKEEFNRAGAVMHLMLGYTQALMKQIEQAAVCNRHHSVDQQLCRWILMRHDRCDGDDLVMTHQLISNLLGVRRESVTQSALKLQKAGLIDYTRGHFKVRDRAGLEHRACECYGVVKRQYDRLHRESIAA
jgi:CRP-like cAMP-binding protein